MNWQPTAALRALQARAALLEALRGFFRQRDVLEVETPLLASAPVTDPAIEAFSLKQADLYLQTSPEYAMKRLLAAGSGPVYQICKAFRQGERGRRHNPEFTMLEWYRPGFPMETLMEEVNELLCTVLGGRPGRWYHYDELFEDYLNLNIFSVETGELLRFAGERHNIAPEQLSRDSALNLLFSVDIEPHLGRDEYSFVVEFPASQAALSNLAKNDKGEWVARRFEVFIDGVELANGYDELTDADEQRQRFEKDLAVRREQGQPLPPIDGNLLAAIEAGLPHCSGVAMGLDRLLMLKLGTEDIADVLAFPVDRA